MTKRDLSEDSPEMVRHDKSTAANVQVTEKAAKKKASIFKASTDALAEARGKGVRVRFKDSGAISIVGVGLGEELIRRGRVEYVDD